MISTIIPSYRNPLCLDICLTSLTDNSIHEDNEIICVIDGYANESQHIIDKFKNRVRFIINKNNVGMQQSINVGVYNSKNEWINIINDDNVFPIEWDKNIAKYLDINTVLTLNQIEPSEHGMFGFIYENFGDPDNFRYQDFLDKEPLYRSDDLTDDGRIFPFILNKKWFMSVGGFDISFPSPFVCDVDFFLKLDLLPHIKFRRTHSINLYHFGSIATRHAKNLVDAERFISSEESAKRIFALKWGFEINKDNKAYTNSYKPNNLILKGISYV